MDMGNDGTQYEIGYIDATMGDVILEWKKGQGGWVYSNRIVVKLQPGQTFNPDLITLYGRPPGETVYQTFDENELNESFKPGNPAAIFDRRYVGSVRAESKDMAIRYFTANHIVTGKQIGRAHV